jgi:hypothetical protein
MGGKNRPGPVGQVGYAEVAGADFSEKLFHVGGGFASTFF